jgi:CRP/FNR family cyclic AMP-dependent transcriptional regulator
LALAIQTILARSHLFRSLSGPELQQVTNLATRRAFREGTIVFSQGDPGDALYGVVTGRIRISAMGSDGHEMFLNIMEPGDTFGEIALLDGATRTATASASAPSELIIIRREPFLALLRREPTVTFHLLELLCQRIRWTSGLAEDSALLNSPTRLARRLLSLSRLNERGPVSGAVRLALSQQDMARFLGLSRQVVNQYLQQWKAQGWVELGRGRISLLDVRALQAIAAGEAAPHSAN